ncbi:hypothetical protein DYQ86_19180 [Acidobacteria bacterium AB60]|nr:hypothetical protein DYQ86_19180 [Acidobacteria bacterium AB60]
MALQKAMRFGSGGTDRAQVRQTHSALGSGSASLDFCCPIGSRRPDPARKNQSMMALSDGSERAAGAKDRTREKWNDGAAVSQRGTAFLEDISEINDTREENGFQPKTQAAGDEGHPVT